MTTAIALLSVSMGKNATPLMAPYFPVRNLASLISSREPGARSAWHTHPLEQNLVVTTGCGWTQCWGGSKREIRAGDVLSCACGEKHWHGATATTGMSHVAIQEALDGKVVEWMEKVTNEQYLREVTPD